MAKARTKKKPEIITYTSFIDGVKASVIRRLYYGPDDIRPLDEERFISPEELEEDRRKISGNIGKTVSLLPNC